MRLMKIPLFLLMVLVLWASGVQAQLGCGSITPSPNDFVKVVPFLGKPGDTARMPIFYDADSVTAGFQVLVKFDTAFLTPAYKKDSVCINKDPLTNACLEWEIDSNFVDYTVTSARFPKTIDSVLDDFGFPISIDTFYNLVISDYQGMKDVIACNFLPFGKIDSLPGGSDNLFSVKFKVKELGHAGKVFHNAATAITFYQANEFYVADTNHPADGILDTVIVGCRRSQLSTLWFDSLTFIEDTTSLSPLVVDTQYVATSYQVWPTQINGGFKVDTAYVDVPDPTVDLIANPSEVASNGTTSLQWVATNIDSVVITSPQFASYRPKFTALTGSTTSPQITTTTTFTITAYKATKTATDQAQVTISGVTPGGPSISFNPTDVSYTIDQGQTVSFSVIGTAGSSGQSITLSMVSPPNNANFSPTNPVVGTTQVTGTCSFTPDFNQSGTFALTFQATTTSTATRSVTVIVNQTARDRLFSVSAPGQKPVGGLRGTPEVKWPINLVTDKTFYGIQFDLAWPYQQVSVDSFTVSGRVPEYIVYDNLGVTPGEVRVLSFGLNNEPVGVDSASGTAVMYAWLTLDSSAVPWTTYWLGLKNGRGSINPNPNFGSVELVTDSGVVECDNPGDVNLDKFIDVADLVNIVAKIIATFDLTFRQFRTADIIVDSNIDVFDLVADINLIYGLPINPAPPQPSPTDVAVMSLAYDDLSSGSSETMAVRSELPDQVAGVQLEVEYDPETVTLGAPKLTAFNEKFTINYKDNGGGRMKVLIYHMKPFRYNELLQPGLADLVEIPMTAKKDFRAGDRSAIRLTQALLSTATAGSITVQGRRSGAPDQLPASPELPQSV